MNYVRLPKFALAVIAALLSAVAVHAQVSALDNFENNNPGTAYNDGIQYGDNGGSGFGALTYLEGTGGGLFDGGTIFRVSWRADCASESGTNMN